MNADTNSTSYIKEALQWIQAVIFAVVIAFLIRGFIFEPVYVDGESMESTLSTGQRLIVFKLGYYLHPPKQGDIVVLQIEEGVVKYMPFLKSLPFVKKFIPDLREIDYIKRIIGVPGDLISTKDGNVYVNGDKLEEPYAQEGMTDGLETPVTVPPNKVFVLGDNRQNSRDSREIGCIDIDRIKGKAVLRIWPVSVMGQVK